MLSFERCHSCMPLQQVFSSNSFFLLFLYFEIRKKIGWIDNGFIHEFSELVHLIVFPPLLPFCFFNGHRLRNEQNTGCLKSHLTLALKFSYTGLFALTYSNQNSHLQLVKVNHAWICTCYFKTQMQ